MGIPIVPRGVVENAFSSPTTCLNRRFLSWVVGACSSSASVTLSTSNGYTNWLSCSGGYRPSLTTNSDRLLSENLDAD